MEPSWRAVLSKEFDKEYFKKLEDFLEKEYQNFLCFPAESQVFSAFNHTPFEDVKVVILGQDPYHGIGQAHGLSFSVPDGIPLPPSLRNIFKELESDLKISTPKSGNLIRWADQGVLLLNAILSVRANEAGSHQQQGWEVFTDAVIECLSAKKEHLVFLLWGGYAKKKGSKIDKKKHLVLTSGHPSPLSANRGLWYGNSHFGKTNEYLKAKGKEQIAW